MDRAARLALLRVLRQSGSEAALREGFYAFTEYASRLPLEQRPTEEAVRDVLLAFGPDSRLARALALDYHRRVWT